MHVLLDHTLFLFVSFSGFLGLNKAYQSIFWNSSFQKVRYIRNDNTNWRLGSRKLQIDAVYDG